MNELKSKKARINAEISSALGAQTSSNTPLSPFTNESTMPPSPSHFPNPSNHIPPIPTNLNTGGGNVHSFFAPRTQPGAQPSLDGTGWKKNVHIQARKAIATFWYYCDLPFNYARSPYWQAMIDAVTIAGPGFKAPSYDSLRTDLLLETVDDVNLALADFRSSWL